MKICIYILCLLGMLKSAYSQNGLSRNISKKIDETVLSYMDNGDIPGLSLVILKDGKQYIKSYGYSNIGNETKVNENTLFELGSCSKAFTALAVMNLVEQNKLNLKAKVSAYLPWFKVNYKGQVENITVEQLLHHTTGIPWNTISLIPESTADDALEQTVKKLIGVELSKKPGGTYEYATIHYDILALLIQEITKTPFETYIQKNIFTPLNLENTTIGIPKDNLKLSQGYKIGFFKARAYDAPRYKGNNAAGYIFTNAIDIGKWLQFQMGLSNSKLFLIAKKTQERDKTVALHDMSAYAMGWEVSLDGKNEIHHSGLNPNFATQIVFRPEDNLGVAVLANSNSVFAHALGYRLSKIIAGEKIENQLKPSNGLDKAFSIMSFILLGFSIIMIVYLVVCIIDIFKKEREYDGINLIKIKKWSLLVLTLIPFVYGIYLFPKAFLNFGWQPILVWMPNSFLVMIKLIIFAIAISLITYTITLLLPHKNQFKRVIPQILLMSILAGLSNVAVITMVTSSLQSEIKLKYLVFYYALIIVVYILGRRFVQVSLVKFTKELIYDLQLKLIHKIFSTSYQKYEKIDRGRVYTALNDDVNTIGVASSTIIILVTSVITTIGAFFYLGSIAIWGALITIFLIVSLTIMYSMVSNSTYIYFEKARDERNVFMKLINGMIDGFKELSLHRNKKIEYKNDISASANNYREKSSKAEIRFVNAFLVGESLLVVLLGLVAFGLPELFPSISFYTTMSFVVVLLYLIGPINDILNAVPSVMNLKISWSRIHSFINEIPGNVDLKNQEVKALETVTHFKVDNVSFTYGGKEDSKNFNIGPINLDIASGEILFIIGGNGSGKTTLAKLLTGLYEPDNGEIKINGKTIENAQLGEYFSTVFSPSYLFEKLYNIDVENKEKEINKYLKLLHLHEKVEITENKYSTIELSAGQKKRLALLQCYMEDSPIYLFDEWAADQDPGYRNFFYRTLLPEMKKAGKIVIAITHDDHYFDVADKVIKMDQGKIEAFDKTETLTQKTTLL
jgi:putative pyoverdin transport system ATP-binding/permease protein